MVEPVSGYRTSQGRFYETKREADLSEAHHQLINALTNYEATDVMPETFISAIRAYPNLVLNYVNAYLEVMPDVELNGYDEQIHSRAPSALGEQEDEEIDYQEPISVVDFGEDNPDSGG